MGDNPDYEADDKLYKFDDFGVVGLDLWQVKSGTIFDNILITDDVAEAEERAKKYFEPTQAGEKKMKDAQDEEESKRREEEAKKREEEEGLKEDDDFEEEEDEEEEEEEDEDFEDV